jgi:phage terminase small subunit
LSDSSRENALTDRQRRFVEEYLVDGNAGAAAVRAGYPARTTAASGARLEKLPHVRVAIEAAMAGRGTAPGITQERVVEELARIAFADIRDFASWDEAGVRLLPSAQLPAGQTACVAEIVESAGKAGKGLRVKLHSKTQALAALARHLDNQAEAAEASAPRPLTIVTCVPEPSPVPTDPTGGEESGEIDPGTG